MRNINLKTIAVEGFDGSGKSTIARWIAENFGFQYHKSPSSCFADARMYFDKPETEARERLAFYTGDCIRISMMLRGQTHQKTVLDRYYYSTIAYHAAKYPGLAEDIRELCKTLYKPDLVLLIKTDFDTISERILKRNENAENDSLFLERSLVAKIYQEYRRTIDVPFIEIQNDGCIQKVQKEINLIMQ